MKGYFILIIFSLLFSSSIYTQDISEKVTMEEALFLRRIIDFWEEGEHEIVKQEAKKYLQENKNSSFNNYLRALLGDILFKDKQYNDALIYYEKIDNPKIFHSSLLNYLQCLYQANKFSMLAKVAYKALAHPSKNIQQQEQIQFFLADGLYRWALSEKDQGRQKKIGLLAIKNYRKLLVNKRYQKESVHALANLHNLMKDYQTASDYYLSIANKYPEQKEHFLFQAALLQSHLDKKHAISMYEQILSLNQQLYKEAGYNRLVLLYETQQYPDIIAEKEIIKKTLNEDKSSYLLFFLGRSYFHLQDHQEAVNHLKRFLKLEEGSNKESKIAMMTLMESANALGDNELFSFALQNFETYFPNDKELPKLLLSKAILEKKLGNVEKARQDFNRIEESQALFEEQEDFLFQYALFCQEVKDYNKSRTIYKKLIQTFPKKKQYWNDLLYVTFKLAKTTNKQPADLLQDLTQFINEQNLASNEECNEYNFLIQQCKFQLQKYEEVIDELPEWIKNNEKSSYLSRAYYMLALSYHKFEKYDLFMYYGKKALGVKDIDPVNYRTLHIAFYNTYLELSKESQAMKKRYLGMAADHLYQAQQIDIEGIDDKNIFWLVDYLFSQAKEAFEKKYQVIFSKKHVEYVTAQKAIELLEKKLFIATHQLVIDDNHLYLEPEVIKLAELYRFIGNEQAQVALLEALVGQYRLSPNYSWAHIEKAYFSLADVYAKRNNREKAMEYYNKILKSNRRSFLQSVAALKRARLRRVLMPLEEITTDNPQVVEDLKHLKNLCINKNMENEPVHLEAAFDYVDLQCLVEKKKDLYKKRLMLFTRLKKSFSQENDVLSKNYHRQRRQMPQQALLYDVYMKMMEVEICLCHIHINKQNLLENKKWRKKAQNILRQFERNNLLINDYLKKRTRWLAFELKKGE